jgi:hypothetical protein
MINDKIKMIPSQYYFRLIWPLKDQICLILEMSKLKGKTVTSIYTTLLEAALGCRSGYKEKSELQGMKEKAMWLNKRKLNQYLLYLKANLQNLCHLL